MIAQILTVLATLGAAAVAMGIGEAAYRANRRRAAKRRAQDGGAR